MPHQPLRGTQTKQRALTATREGPQRHGLAGHTAQAHNGTDSDAFAPPPAPRPGCRAVGGSCDLEAFLRRIAPGGEVLVAISNFHLAQGGGPLTTWIERVRKAGVGPWMVLAIDEALHGYLTAQGAPSYLLKADVAAVQAGTGSNHAVSALKFGLLAEFLQLGWSVLLSDVDVVVLQDPFPHLFRDRDIEGARPPFDARGSSSLHLSPSGAVMLGVICTKM